MQNKEACLAEFLNLQLFEYLSTGDNYSSIYFGLD